MKPLILFFLLFCSNSFAQTQEELNAAINSTKEELKKAQGTSGYMPYSYGQAENERAQAEYIKQNGSKNYIQLSQTLEYLEGLQRKEHINSVLIKIGVIVAVLIGIGCLIFFQIKNSKMTPSK